MSRGRARLHCCDTPQGVPPVPAGWRCMRCVLCSVPLVPSTHVQSVAAHCVLCSVLHTHLQYTCLPFAPWLAWPVRCALCHLCTLALCNLVLCTVGRPLCRLCPCICLPYLSCAPCLPYHCLRGEGGRFVLVWFGLASTRPVALSVPCTQGLRHGARIAQRPPFSPLATGLWAKLCRCSPAPVARQGLNQRPLFAPLASGLWGELCRCSPAQVVCQGSTYRRCSVP